MSSPPAETNTAAGSGSADEGLKVYKNSIKNQINTNMEELKKGDNKLAGNVAELKKEGVSIVEKLLKEQPELTDQDKFMEDFYKTFEGRLKQMGEVRKQLKNKGLTDLKATMGSIVHMSFFDQAVLPMLNKKERPSSDKFLAIFETRFDSELDVLMKKKEFKMYKDTAVEVGGAALNNIMTQMADKDKELEKLRKQPKGSDREKELQLEVTKLQREINHLTEKQKTMKDDHDDKLATEEGRFHRLEKQLSDNNDFIAGLEGERDVLQTKLKEETDAHNVLKKGQGPMQAKLKELEAKMEAQVTQLETEKFERTKAEEALESLKADLEEAQKARTEANEAWDKDQETIQRLEAKARENRSKAQDVETEQTIKDLRDQAEKVEKELNELKTVRAAELSKFKVLLSKSKEETMDEKTRFKSLAADLANAQKATEEQTKEVSGLKEKHEQLETTHREAEKKNAVLVQEKDELAKKHEQLETTYREAETKNADLVQEKEELAKKHEDAVEAHKTSEADNNEEVKGLKARCDALMDSEKSLATIVEQQKERLEQFEADKAAAGDTKDTSKLLRQIEEGMNSEAKLKAEIEKLNATVKEQTEKAKGGDVAKELADLRMKHDKLANDHAALQEKKDQSLELQTALEDTKEDIKAKDKQVKELEKRNAELTEAIGKAPAAGKGTLDTVSEEDEEDQTAEQRIATYQQQWAEAKKELDAMTNDRNRLNQELTRAVSGFKRMEQQVDTNRMESATREEEYKAAVADIKKELEDARAVVASQKKALANAIAAVAAGGKAAPTGEQSKAPGSSSEMDAASTGPIGEATLAPRDSTVPAPAPTGRFEGLTDIFGRGRTGGRAAATPQTANGADPVGNVSLVSDKGPADGNLSKALTVLTVILLVCAVLTIGAEGHKASIWHSANHLTRAQYANDWYYLTIPLPQWEYVWYLLKF